VDEDTFKYINFFTGKIDIKKPSSGEKLILKRLKTISHMDGWFSFWLKKACI
jgi:hypothetical protein